MSRYFFYLYLVCMFINTIFFVPRLLLEEVFDGALMAMLLSVLIGSAYAVLFLGALRKFPGEGIQEIFQRSLPGFVRVPLLLFFGVMWAIAGSLILIAFSSITLRFLNPETSLMVLLLIFCGICCWAATHRPVSILYVLEIVMLLNLPVVTYILYKALTSNWFEWDAVLLLSDYVVKTPSWLSIASATYSFAGYLNMAVYNRMFKGEKIRMQWLIPLIGIVVLFTSIIVPIGLLGVDSVGQYIYTWITSADTLRLQFGVIERIVYLFLFVYIGFSLLFITITWNIGSLLIQRCFPVQDLSFGKRKLSIQTLVCAAFAIATFFTGMLITDKQLIAFVSGWQLVRIAAETLLVGMVVLMAWGRRRNHA